MSILSDGVKEQLLKLIKDGLQFVDQPNKYACRNCGNVPIFHYTYPCSHLYCRDCYKTLAKQKKKCKVCQTDLGFEMLQNREVELEIYTLKVICPNSLYGCQEILELFRILFHQDECRFTTKNLLPILFTSKESKITEESCDQSEIENSISEMKVAIETLTKSLLELEKRLVNENEAILSTNTILSEDVQKMKNENDILSSEVRKVKNENRSLSQEFRKVKEENKNLSQEFQKVKREDNILSNEVLKIKNENRSLSKEFQTVKDENIRLSQEFQKVKNENNINSNEVQKVKNENRSLLQEFQKVKDKNISLSQEFQKVKDENQKFISETQTVVNEMIGIVNANDKNQKNNRKLINKRITDLKKQQDQDKTDSREDNLKFAKKFYFFEQKIEQCSETVATMETEVTNRIKNLKSCQQKQELEDVRTRDKQQLTDSIVELRQFVLNKIHNVEIGAHALMERVDLIDPKSIEAERKRSFQELNLNTLTTQEIKLKMAEIRGWKNGTLLWQIKNYSGLKNSFFQSQVYSDPFYSSDGGHKMGATLRFDKDGCLTGFIQFRPGNHDDLLPSGYHYRATFSILNQSAIKKKKDATLVIEPRFGTSAQDWMKRASNLNSVRFKTFTNQENLPKYSKNDTIYIKVLVEPLSPLFEDKFDVLMWQIDNYERTKQESLDFSNEYIYSEYFYTECEYRMQARITWKLDSIVCDVFYLVGESDDELSSLCHKCTVAIAVPKNIFPSDDHVLGEASLVSVRDGLNTVKMRMASDSCYSFTISSDKVELFLYQDKVTFKISA